MEKVKIIHGSPMEVESKMEDFLEIMGDKIVWNYQTVALKDGICVIIDYEEKE